MSETAPAKMKAGKPIWPKIPAGFVRSVLAGHSALGLAFAALIYLVCFSGSVAVFAREFQRWEQAANPAITTVTPAAIQAAMTAAVQRVGDGIEHVYITPPTPDLPRLTVMTDSHGVQRTFTADANGRLTSEGEAVWTEFMTRLHINLHLPKTWGMFIVGLTGVALLSSLISGVLAHPRVFKDAFHLRWGGSKRLQEADLHNRLGVWALPFHVVVSLTGALLGLTTIIVGVLAMAMFQGDTSKAYALFLPPIVDDPRPAAALPDLIAAMEATQRLSPGSKPTFVGLEHPTEQGQAVMVNATLPNRLMAADTFYFNGKGQLLDASKTGATNLGEKILGSLGPLHFGWYGGLVIKLAYGLLGLALTSVTASGVAIWLARRGDKGRPAPRWERIWIGTVWSQPLAFAASALVTISLGGGDGLPLVVWGFVTIITLAVALAFEPKRLSRLLRLTSAIAILATVAVHLLRHGGLYADQAGWGMSAALVMVTLILLASLQKGRTAS
ncbi:putative iron-regulated membrane protein [Brevundimonas vesicularis]|uniref:PepSY-associated TM helix domain-containing protein n=1 Tax=Brevundimonas vesicularis TaxID=41276 RepID=UPI0027834277|nr:PepSY-associated TM helix domain-containing protein [Brevundimonas vesicularis]MDQ1193816.1 putative iron-regulated membrane protein [Brevundimonas vesicularis]